MIFELIVEAVTSVLSWVLGLFAFAMPAWFDTSVTTLSGWLGQAGQFGGWLPMQAFSDVVTLLLAAYALSWLIRLTRIGLSAFTGGGGSAA